MEILRFLTLGMTLGAALGSIRVRTEKSNDVGHSFSYEFVTPQKIITGCSGTKLASGETKTQYYFVDATGVRKYMQHNQASEVVFPSPSGLPGLSRIQRVYMFEMCFPAPCNAGACSPSGSTIGPAGWSMPKFPWFPWSNGVTFNADGHGNTQALLTPNTISLSGGLGSNIGAFTNADESKEVITIITPDSTAEAQAAAEAAAQASGDLASAGASTNTTAAAASGPAGSSANATSSSASNASASSSSSTTTTTTSTTTSTTTELPTTSSSTTTTTEATVTDAPTTTTTTTTGAPCTTTTGFPSSTTTSTTTTGAPITDSTTTPTTTTTSTTPEPTTTTSTTPEPTTTTTTTTTTLPPDTTTTSTTTPAPTTTSTAAPTLPPGSIAICNCSAAAAASAVASGLLSSSLTSTSTPEPGCNSTCNCCDNCPVSKFLEKLALATGSKSQPWNQPNPWSLPTASSWGSWNSQFGPPAQAQPTWPFFRSDKDASPPHQQTADSKRQTDPKYYASLPGAIRGQAPVIYYPSCDPDAFFQPAIINYCTGYNTPTGRSLDTQKERSNVKIIRKQKD